MTKEEVERLERGASTDKTRLLVRVLWETGARISEALEIKAEDLDEKNMVVKFRRRKVVHEVVVCPDLMWRMISVRKRGRIFAADNSSAWRALRKLGEGVLGRKISPEDFRKGREFSYVKHGKAVSEGVMIYFLVSREVGLVKIGKSQNVEKRVGNIKGMSPVKLEYLGAISEKECSEKKIHGDLEKYREHYEWFRMEPVVEKYIESLTLSI